MDPFPIYDRTPDQEVLAGRLAASWGKFTRFLEVGPDRYATRQVDVFENGHALRYDRIHYIDEYGALADLRYTAKWQRWWPNSERIDQSEFERIWAGAASNMASLLQEKSSESASWPAQPPWLR